MAKFVIEFDSASDLAAAAAVLEGKASAEVPNVSIVNMMGSNIAAVARPGEDGSLVVELHPRTIIGDAEPQAVLLPPKHLFKVT